jgi:hypothetical protein
MITPRVPIPKAVKLSIRNLRQIAPSQSAQELRSPSAPPLRTGRAPFDAYGSSIGQRTENGTRLSALAVRTTCTLLRESQQRNRRKPHQQERCAPLTFLLCFLKSVCSPFTYANTRGKSAGFRRGVCCWRRNPYPTHYRPAFACSLLLYPPPHQRLLREPPSLTGRRRAYHVPPLSPCGLGRASSPVVRQLRRRSSEPPDLTTYLLVQAIQHLALGLCDVV